MKIKYYFCKVISSVDSTPLQSNSFDFGFSETTYSHFLCFKVSTRTDKLVFSQLKEYSSRQQEIHDKIKSMKDSGMSYRQITEYLNQNDITTHTGKRWGETGNSVYSVLKRNKERLDSIEYQKQEYEPLWSDMRLIRE